MPPGNAGSLSAETTTELVAFLLEANGAAAGNRELNASAGVPIRSIANGQMPAAVRDALNQAGDPQTGAPPPRPKGLSVRGEVKNYVPVTDEMLRNPDPGDWPMIRRNYQAWSYSPLTEITTRNVNDLRLAWVWAMNDGGASQPTPLVHNGIIYLANTSNMVQALDGERAI
jgi:hypothetical protein